MVDTSAVIRTVKLGKRYQPGQNSVRVFENLCLEVGEGERLALVGQSGAGKSTLLHLLGGLDRPSEGSIYFAGNDITRLDENALASFRNREIGFVWQTHYLLPEFTAAENVMMPLLIRGVTRTEALRAAHQRLEEVGLNSRASHRAGELSGGEQQRVVIARALAGRPRVLLADEPTGNLDHSTGDRVADVFDELHRQYRLTSVFVTHNIAFARRCDRVLQLEDGVLLPFSDTVSGVEPGRSSHGSFAGLQREGSPEDSAGKVDGTTHV